MRGAEVRPETLRGREDQRLRTDPGTSRAGGRTPLKSLRGGEYGRGETTAPSVSAAPTATTVPTPSTWAEAEV